MALLPAMFSKNKKPSKGVPDMIAFRVGIGRQEEKCRMCDTLTRDMLSVNGIKFPSCGHMDCNKKIIDLRKGMFT